MLAYSGKKVPRMWRSFESSSVTGLYHVRKSLYSSEWTSHTFEDSTILIS